MSSKNTKPAPANAANAANAAKSVQAKPAPAKPIPTKSVQAKPTPANATRSVQSKSSMPGTRHEILHTESDQGHVTNITISPGSNKNNVLNVGNTGTSSSPSTTRTTKISTKGTYDGDELPKTESENIEIEKKQKYTDEEFRAKLGGYILVPKENYADLPKAVHVRYIKTDGSKIAGAYVRFLYEKDGVKILALTSNPTLQSGYTYNRRTKTRTNVVTWMVKFTDIDKLYKKIEPDMYIELQLINNSSKRTMEMVKKTVDYIRTIEARVLFLEQKIKQMESSLARQAR